MKNIRILYMKIFICLVVKYSIYLNRRVFAICSTKGTLLGSTKGTLLGSTKCTLLGSTLLCSTKGTLLGSTKGTLLGSTKGSHYSGILLLYSN